MPDLRSWLEESPLFDPQAILDMERRHKAEQTGLAYELFLQHVVNHSKQTSEVSMRSKDVVSCALNVFGKEIEYAKLDTLQARCGT